MIFRAILLISLLSANVDNVFGGNADKWWKKFNYVDVIMGMQQLVPVGIEAKDVGGGAKVHRTLYLCRALDGSQLYPGKLFLETQGDDGTAYCDFAGDTSSQYRILENEKDRIEVLTIRPEYTSWVPNTSKLPQLYIDGAARRKICRTKVGDTIHVGYPNSDYSRCYYDTHTTYSATNIEVLAFNSLGRRYGM